jgi:hypothetical protein
LEEIQIDATACVQGGVKYAFRLELETKKQHCISLWDAEVDEEGADDRRRDSGVVKSREVCKGVRLSQPV